MLEYLKQLKELSEAVDSACETKDVDRIVTLMHRRKKLADSMGSPDPQDPDVESGKVAELLKEIVELDGRVEGKIREVMTSLQNAIRAVQGEKQIVKGYLKKTDEIDPEYLDKEG